MKKTPLGTTLLGKTGLDITRVGFGAWAIGGGGWEFGWGPQDDDDSIAAIQHALDLGVNWIDTAAAYGFGRSEETVGRALDGLRADEPGAAGLRLLTKRVVSFLISSSHATDTARNHGARLHRNGDHARRIRGVGDRRR